MGSVAHGKSFRPLKRRLSKLSINITIPAQLCDLSGEDQRILDLLMQKFGAARRRAYQLKKKGLSKGRIEKILQTDFQLNGRYSKDAYYSIKDLPLYGVTFGGIQNQRLREKAKIKQDDFTRRKNRVLYARGEKSKQGNLNLRLDLKAKVLRINTCYPLQKYLYVPFYIPRKYIRKYRPYLDGTQAYTVLITRVDSEQGYNLHIIVELSIEVPERPRLLALDVNAGHTDFAVLDKSSCRLVAVGIFTHPETQHTRKTKRTALLYQLTEEIERLANHYDAEVIVGKLQTTKIQDKVRKARRTIRQMPQHQFRQILAYWLPKRGIRVKEYSEAYTSRGGQKLGPFLGLDVHKCAAILFALKVINYPFFKVLVNFLQRVSFNEGCGRSRRMKQPEGCPDGLTALIQNGRVGIPSHLSPRMKFWMTMILFQEDLRNSGGNSEMPGIWGLSFLESLKSAFAYHSLAIS